jgi:hypothetical protein
MDKTMALLKNCFRLKLHPQTKTFQSLIPDAQITNTVGPANKTLGHFQGAT